MHSTHWDDLELNPGAAVLQKQVKRGSQEENQIHFPDSLAVRGPTCNQCSAVQVNRRFGKQNEYAGGSHK